MSPRSTGATDDWTNDPTRRGAVALELLSACRAVGTVDGDLAERRVRARLTERTAAVERVAGLCGLVNATEIRRDGRPVEVAWDVSARWPWETERLARAALSDASDARPRRSVRTAVRVAATLRNVLHRSPSA